MSSLPEAAHQQEAFFDAALRLQDELLQESRPEVAEQANFPFAGQDLWDTYFIREAIQCLSTPPRRVMLYARANVPLRRMLSKTGADIVDHEPAPPGGILRTVMPKRWQKASGGLAAAAKKGRTRPDDVIVIDNLINEVPDPVGLLRDLAASMDDQGAVICVMRQSPEGVHDHFQELGFVIPAQTAVAALRYDNLRVEMAAKTTRPSDNDSWPPFKIMGLFLRRAS